MNANPLEATVSGDGEHARIVLRGRIDRDGDAALAEASGRAAALGAPVVELDFSAVDYINSTGIALIVRRGAPGPSRGPCARAHRALPGDLPDHPPV